MIKQINEYFPRLRFATLSEQGLIRKNNEDALIGIPADGCFAVADGMGGADAGEIASSIVVNSIKEAISGSCNESPGERKYILQQSLQRAHKQIINYIASHGYSSMGSTVALLVFDPWDSRKALICHVGDSRVYCFRNEELFRITNDHNIATEIFKGNESESVKLKNSSLKTLLTRSIGAHHPLFPEWTQVSVCLDDIFLICSDGITSMLSDEEIEKIIRACEMPDEIIANLRNAVFAAGAKDNFSMICVGIDGLTKSFTPSELELKESNYLLKISEERFDYGTN